MLEGGPKKILERGTYPLIGNPSKVYKRVLRLKERAVLKERTRKMIEDS